MGGNLGFHALPHLLDGFGIPGTKSGNILISAGGSVSTTARTNINMTSITGSASIVTSQGGINLSANRNMLMKTVLGEMVINSATTLDMISTMNMKLETNMLCTQRFGNLNTLVDNIHFHKVPSYVRETDLESVSTLTRSVVGDTLEEVFKSNISFGSKGKLFMGSNGDMKIQSTTANINMKTGPGVINLNSPEKDTRNAADVIPPPSDGISDFTIPDTMLA